MTKHAWQETMETGDLIGLDDLLADDVTFYSPLVHTPFKGKKLVGALVPLLRKCFSDVEYIADLSSDDRRMRALVSSVRIGGHEGENIQLLTLDDAGLILSIRVMLRPFSIGKALSQLMAPLVERLEDGSYIVKGMQ